MSLDHTKRMSKKADVDRAWLEYYRDRPMKKRTTGGMTCRRRILDYHVTKGWRGHASS